MIKAVLTLAISVAFAMAMPAPYYMYVWNANRMNTNGSIGGWDFTQSATNSPQGGWMGYDSNGNQIAPNLDDTGVPTIISGSGAPPYNPPDPPPNTDKYQ